MSTNLQAEAKKLAHEVNYNHSLTSDERYALSMKLSIVIKKLGAMGVDKAHDQVTAEEGQDNE